MSEKKMGGTILKGLIEIVAIVFGVLLALWVDQAAQAREDRAQAREVLGDFRAQILQNREIVVRRAEYHERALGVLDSLLVVARSGGEVDLSRPPLERGFGFEPIADTVWETASVTDALTLLDFATVRPIGRAYQTQEVIEEFERILLAGVVRPETFAGGDPAPTLFFMRVVLGDMASVESSLQGLYDEALESIRTVLGELGQETSAGGEG